LLAFFIAGPPTLLAYGLAYRQPLGRPHPETALTTPKRALGSALIGLMGYTLGLLVTGFIIERYLIGSRRTLQALLACIYVPPLAISLLCFRLPLTFRLSDRGIFATLGRTTLVEFISLNVGMIVLLPVSNTAYSRLPLPKPAALTDFSSWLLYWSPMLLVTIAMLLVIYPLHAWMTHHGLSQWLFPVQTRKASWWMVLLMVLVSMVMLFLALQITMLVTNY
jgi:hypothetical protein